MTSGFTFTTLSPGIVAFFNSSVPTTPATGYPINASWDFGDGTTSVAFSPIHIFQNSGVYTVQLSATGPEGTIVTSHTVVVTIVHAEVNFSHTSTALVIAFTDTSTIASITSWDWNFGDGTAHSSSQNPSHTYSASGHYIVTLTINGSLVCEKNVLVGDGYTTVVHDSFTGSDGTAIQSHTPETGSAWVQGGDGADYKIYGNKLKTMEDTHNDTQSPNFYNNRAAVMPAKMSFDFDLAGTAGYVVLNMNAQNKVGSGT